MLNLVYIRTVRFVTSIAMKVVYGMDSHWSVQYETPMGAKAELAMLRSYTVWQKGFLPDSVAPHPLRGSNSRPRG